MTLKLTKREALAGQTPKTLHKLQELAEKQLMYLEKIRGTYTEKYPRQWIAVVDSTAMGPTKGPEELLQLLSEQGIDVSKVTFGYLDPDYQKALLL